MVAETTFRHLNETNLAELVYDGMLRSDEHPVISDGTAKVAA